MQGRRELGGEPLSDLQEEAASASLRVAPERLSDDSLEWRRTCPDLLLSDGKASISMPREGGSTCTARCPDPGEHSSTWGEFEGFRESSAKSGQFSQSLELLEGPTEPQPPRTTSAPKECSSHQPCQGGPWVTGTSAVPPSEPILSYENILKCAFQEITVQQAAEDVSTIDHFLEISSEEKPGVERVHKLWDTLSTEH
ncbi:clathrin binding box of aftiphilin containing 1 [Homo sapiens]|uniref:Chromosome 14 open reading frame 79, isoform CRA_a n=1 Tax=Homo sapiens TaxID=9606 RepID=J3KPM0_HUMAN|nr:chromosome 14 open reading frame 79, isoform CRA_a [Homo sapiens]KAI2573079.1 clathrin binding box of aftiphilin containing 1 [Homo sapiens]KAI4062700.1 clathrin binding box of aftiphilin containing 1 [Homo sapiens]